MTTPAMDIMDRGMNTTGMCIIDVCISRMDTEKIYIHRRRKSMCHLHRLESVSFFHPLIFDSDMHFFVSSGQRSSDWNMNFDQQVSQVIVGEGVVCESGEGAPVAKGPSAG